MVSGNGLKPFPDYRLLSSHLELKPVRPGGKHTAWATNE